MGKKKRMRFRFLDQLEPYRVAQAYGDESFPSDVQGSYTGQGEHGDDPVQDADDL